MWPNLLISTTFNLFLFYDSKFYPILNRKLDDQYYGISWDKNSLYVGTNSCIYKINKDFGTDKIKDYGVNVDIHQILFHKDRLYLNYPYS